MLHDLEHTEVERGDSSI